MIDTKHDDVPSSEKQVVTDFDEGEIDEKDASASDTSEDNYRLKTTVTIKLEPTRISGKPTLMVIFNTVKAKLLQMMIKKKLIKMLLLLTMLLLKRIMTKT